MFTRREAIKAALFSTTALAASLRPLHADAPTLPPAAPPLTIAPSTPGNVISVEGPFVLPPLPYAYDALEPYIDAQTMQIHHDKHHAAYVKNLNAAVAKLPQDHEAPRTGDVAPLVTNLLVLPSFGITAGQETDLTVAGKLLVPPSLNITNQSDPTFIAIRNNGGGHYNHSLFWKLMKKGGGGQPTKDLAALIDKQFGSYAGFQAEFTKAALGQFGSGWAWLSLASDFTLKVESTPNQDSPIMLGRTPLLGIDVWEHAYYLKYQNRRPEYVPAWYNTIDWDFVNDRFTQAKRSVLEQVN